MKIIYYNIAKINDSVVSKIFSKPFIVFVVKVIIIITVLEKIKPFLLILILIIL
jgi:hypothetical protein